MDDVDLWASLALFVLCSLFTAVGAASQATLQRIGRARLRQLVQDESPRTATGLQGVVEQPSTLLSTTVVISTIALAAAASSGLVVVMQQWALAWWAGLLWASVLLASLLLLQLLARAVALHRPERSIRVLLGPMRVLSLALFPFVWPVIALERWLVRALHIAPASATHGDDELRRLVEVAEENGVPEEERDMIHGIFNLSQRPVREIMVPRIDVVAQDRKTLVREMLPVISKTGHSRIPIYDGSVDNVVGILHAKDLLKHLETGSLDVSIEALGRPARFVPETKKIDELLHEMQKTKGHLSIVVDEYGGTAGLVTIEDLLEEIVGEIQDEYDVEEALYERISEREAIMDARMNLRDVGEILNLDLTGELEEHEFDTIGGLVYERLGKVPTQGDQVQVNGCLISVLSTEGHRIKKVRVELGAHPPASSEQSERKPA